MELKPDRLFASAPLLVVAGGALYGLHVYYPAITPLAFISTIPWVLLLLGRDIKYRALWFFGMLYLMAVIALFWLAHFNVQSWLVAPLFYLPLFLPLYLITRIVRKSWPSFPLVVLWPTVFTGVEWFRVRCSPGQIPFGQLGYALIDVATLVQIVDVLGTSALTFMLCMVCGLAADLLLRHSEGRHLRLTAALGVAGVALVFAAVIAYGVRRYSEKTFSYDRRVMAVQPLLSSWHDKDSEPRNLDLLEQKTRDTVPQAVDLIAWPENSVSEAENGTSERSHRESVDRIEKLTRELGIPIMFDGAITKPSGERVHSTTLITPQGVHQVYDKVILVPWSEYLPFQAFLAKLSAVAERAYLKFVAQFSSLPATMTAGNIALLRPMVIEGDRGAMSFGTPVCAEIGSAQLLRRWYRYRHGDGKSGIDFVLNPTNEILLGRGVYRQTVTAARFRAIEGRVPVLRVANAGMSTLIDSNGRVRHDLIQYSGDPHDDRAPEVMFATLPRDSRSRTIYVGIGDVFPMACFAISIVLATAAVTLRFKQRLK